MRHQKHHSSLGVTKEHRRAMLSNLAAALITHGRIQTTLTKARALRPFIEKIITKAKHAAGKSEPRDALHLRRLALGKVRDENALTLLFNEKHKEFANRNGGYTRIYKLGPQRIGDAAELALIEFVKADDPGYKKSGSAKKKKGAKRPKSAQPAVEPAAEAPVAGTPAAGAAEPAGPAAETPPPEGGAR